MYSGRRESVNFKEGTGLIVRKGQEEDREKKEGNLDVN
jgi:hypothetical protein